MYNITKETQSESQYKTFGAGIYGNVELESIEFKPINAKINNNEPTLAFNFVGSKGEKINLIEYPAESQNDPEKSAAYTAGRVKHILSKFMPSEEVTLSGSNYAEFANRVIALLGDKAKGKKVFIKLTYGTKAYPNKKNRLDFPKFPDFISNDNDLKMLANDLINPISVTPSTEEELGAEDMNFETPPQVEEIF